eukprot:TRINITY_DN49543_c0_g1_i1.p1 TRINITY_DN49543_c0_g1~~TRINITY_DN49543_c0_g1_i1.p1  ORF type:complete len:398 (+),score=62.42 TRINITY_DN49543_c0_g1_i1:147-1340(+)
MFPVLQVAARCGRKGNAFTARLTLGAACAATGLAFGGSRLYCEERRSKNIPLGGAASKHEIAITAWSFCNPRKQDGLDETVKSFNGCFLSLCSFLKEHGYDGLEISVEDTRRGGWFPAYLGDDEVVSQIQHALTKTGLKVTGSLLHVTDGGAPIGASLMTGLDFNNPGFFEALRRCLELQKRIGVQYVTFQIDLQDRFKGTGGAYRNDEEYLRLTAARVQAMQRVCHEAGVNFYVETHIDRISEDPEAFCKIFDYCPSYFEVNADISHYLYRNICRGPHYDRIMERVGHSHQRLARKHGDLSAEPGVSMGSIGQIGDASADWESRGVTWEALEAMKPALQRGLSSRAIVGEAGPAFMVKDALALDTKLVPLYRAMALLADGRPLPEGSNPWRCRETA